MEWAFGRCADHAVRRTIGLDRSYAKRPTNPEAGTMMYSQNTQLRLAADRQADLQRAAALQRRWRGSDLTDVDVPDEDSVRTLRWWRWPLVARLLAAVSRG